jgi:hypothetical protein
MLPNMRNAFTWILASLVTAAALSLGLIFARQHIGFRVRLADDVGVALRGAFPLHAALDQPIDVTIDKELAAKIKLGTLRVDLDEVLDLPIDMRLEVPIDSDLRIDQALDLKLTVPIDTVLTERELDLSQVTVPIDTDVFIDDSIDLDIVLPIDTEVTTTLGLHVPVKAQIPVKMKVPIHQKLHVRDNLKLGVHKLRVPLKLSLPVRVHLPLDQNFRVRGTIVAPVKQRLRVPLRKTITPKLAAEVPVMVRLSGQMPANLKTKLDATVTIDRPLQTRLSPLRIGATDVSVDYRP